MIRCRRSRMSFKEKHFLKFEKQILPFSFSFSPLAIPLQSQLMGFLLLFRN